MKPLADCRLYTFVDTAYLHGRTAAAVARDLCAGGSDLIQLRAKNLHSTEVLRLAREILPITRAHDVGLVINDHPELAQELGADLCHLGQEDYFDAGLRSPTKFGLSTHTPAQAARALAANPDYIAIGPIYSTPTKPTAQPVTLSYVQWAAANVTIPWFAIGGINLTNLDAVLAAGATRVCVVSAMLNASNIAAACREFKGQILARMG